MIPSKWFSRRESNFNNKCLQEERRAKLEDAGSALDIKMKIDEPPMSLMSRIAMKAVGYASSL